MEWKKNFNSLFIWIRCKLRHIEDQPGQLAAEEDGHDDKQDEREAQLGTLSHFSRCFSPVIVIIKCSTFHYFSSKYHYNPESKFSLFLLLTCWEYFCFDSEDHCTDFVS